MSAKISFDHYRTYIAHAKIVSEVNDDISKFIEYYVFKKMEYIGERLSGEDKHQFLELLNKLDLNRNKVNITKEYYVNFLIKLFRGVDDEERTGVKSLELCAGFRLVADLIELIFCWETIPYEWKVISKLIN